MLNSVTSWLDITADLYPNKTAIVDSFGSVSWKQYREKSIGIARLLSEKKYGPRRPVVVYMKKTSAVLISFMGIAYSGNFYSPIDTSMPAVRSNKILEILKPGIVITTKSLLTELKNLNFDGDIVFYEDVNECEASEIVIERQKSIIDTDLLYVLFTSGSTGIPKGVCISHGSVVDYIDWVTSTFDISAEDSFGNQAPFYFDNSILDIYSTMKTGATLYIVPQNLFSQPVPLLEYLKEREISTIFWVPSALIVVSRLKAFKNVDLSESLRRVLFCGEVMPNKQLNVWREYLPEVVYANLYGPTEITDACTYYIVDREFRDDEPLPIGIPMNNTDILVLDEHDNLVVNEGIVGELCVRGTGLAKGYYGNPEKTEMAFVQNPLNHVYPEKIYRTGDIVQYNERHELIYLSRKDFQIKHMGHRIELGEIETAVSSLEEISLCCCLYNDSRNRITLFIDRQMTKDDINEKLKNLIPEYMLPGKVIVLEEMPINANGKIDRVKLKEMMQ
ncbi:MAG: amino acid adenylation domain-containing protein [Lachnospiraceae bacterium]|nr:amino acid adenylation domain-containing protein [Lachnospiraceae bacterium]